jgi:hypothetical protein
VGYAEFSDTKEGLYLKRLGTTEICVLSLILPLPLLIFPLPYKLSQTTNLSEILT